MVMVRVRVRVRVRGRVTYHPLVQSVLPCQTVAIKTGEITVFKLN
jgi:hypothetical protein